MSNGEEDTPGGLIEAGVAVVKVAYDDALKPVSKQVGKALETLGKSINVALSPLRGMVWGWEKIEEYLTITVERKLQERQVSHDHVKTPDPDIAVPAMEALRYTKLRENYANLIATAMNDQTANDAHPSFVEILKQLTPDEAKMLEYLPNVGRYEPIVDLGYTLPDKGTFTTHRHVGTLASDAKCEDVQSLPQLVDNLCRLGLTDIPPLLRLNEVSRYDRIRALEQYGSIKAAIPHGGTFHEALLMIGLTHLGVAFRRACIDPLGPQKR